MDDLAALRLQIEWGADEALEVEPVDRLRVQRPLPNPYPRSNCPAPGEASTPNLSPALGAGEGWGRGRPRAVRTTPARTCASGRHAAPTLEAPACCDCRLRRLRAARHRRPPGLRRGRSVRRAVADRRCAGRGRGPVRCAIRRARGRISRPDARLRSGWNAAGLLLTPLIPWRPPGDRPPSPTELAICLPFLCRLIALAAPRRIVLLGPLAPRALLVQTTRRRPRGAWLDASIPGLSQHCLHCPHSAPAS